MKPGNDLGPAGLRLFAGVRMSVDGLTARASDAPTSRAPISAPRGACHPRPEAGAAARTMLRSIPANTIR
jgi:hypothetical protein